MEQSKYLIQVRPPGDTLPDIIRSLVTDLNITNAGILYDESFVMDHKYRSLLLNLPTRHIIKPLETTDAGIKDQLTRLESVDINNFFVLASLANLKMVYGVASRKGMTGEKYAWFAGTKDSGQEFDQTCCERMKVAFFHASPIPSNIMRSLKTMKNGLTGMPEVDAGFYFDLAVRAATSMKKLMAGGSLPNYSLSKCSEYTETTPVARSIDLLSVFKVDNPGMSYAYGPMKISSNGLSMMNFKVNLLSYTIESMKVADRKEIGSWEWGSSIMYSPGMMNSMSGFRATTVYRVVTVLQAPFMMMDEQGNSCFNKSFISKSKTCSLETTPEPKILKSIVERNSQVSILGS
ncbi:ionotropic receptor 25a [Eurytemora carolleeae]|uniref:ionotropic receptor 25a n=1 Tax=Eurytemora carolleeae TaxID=1294199 RepID=UPI000C7596B2|nr:ionotropic receptor 25a [Eurytemora carolleeae]|eukprot:XP_023346465.1 ionotropic receptor 25a-like [Eurytemora affinis]